MYLWVYVVRAPAWGRLEASGGKRGVDGFVRCARMLDEAVQGGVGVAKWDVAFGWYEPTEARFILNRYSAYNGRSHGTAR